MKLFLIFVSFFLDSLFNYYFSFIQIPFCFFFVASLFFYLKNSNNSSFLLILSFIYILSCLVFGKNPFFSYLSFLLFYPILTFLLKKIRFDYLFYLLIILIFIIFYNLLRMFITFTLFSSTTLSVFIFLFIHLLYASILYFILGIKIKNI